MAYTVDRRTAAFIRTTDSKLCSNCVSIPRISSLFHPPLHNCPHPLYLNPNCISFRKPFLIALQRNISFLLIPIAHAYKEGKITAVSKICLRAYCVVCAMTDALYFCAGYPYLIYSSQQHWMEGSIITSILQMEKLRLGEKKNDPLF